MTLSPDEAANALRDIAAVETRSRRAYGYREASPHLILWGVLWAVGYGLHEPWPQRGWAIWMTIIAIGLAADFAISLSDANRRDAQGGRVADPTQLPGEAWLRWRFPGIVLTAFAFIAATLAVMAPHSGRQIGAFIPLVVAASYAVAGLWLGLRFIVAGAVIGGLTLGGFFLVPAHFNLWMAGVGGGALILAGCWFRGI
jgi:hypothetical protein